MDQKLTIAALVAMVALVGLVVLMDGANSGAVTVISGNLGPDRGFPEREFMGSSFEGNTYCVFVGVDECPSGILCNNLQRGEEYCN